MMVRALTACAVLVGLVSMHGLDPVIGTGCPGGTSSTVTSAALPTTGGGHHAATARVTTAVPVASTPFSGHSSVCDSMPPRGDLTGRLAQAATDLVEPGAPGQPALGIQRAGVAVPRAGPALLISLGVSRT
jgi:hypothetical protein